MSTPQRHTTAAEDRVLREQLRRALVPQRHTTAAEDRVPWNQLIAFGMGGVIPIALFNIAGQLVGLLGNISLGISAVWLGAIMFVPRLWDAVSDPIIGYLSDQTRTRWGRRRPFILVGGLTVAVSFVAIWWVPRGEWIRDVFPGDAAYGWFQLVYILGGLLIFFTACTVFEIPHGALGMELSSDPQERTRLFSAKSFLGNLFAMGTPWLILLAELFRGPGGDLMDGTRIISILIALALIPMSFWWFFALREPRFAQAKLQPRGSFWRDMHITVKNRTFVLLTAIIFTLSVGFNFVTNFANYITIFYLYGGDVKSAAPLLGINGTVWAVTGLVAVFPLNWISRRVGKRLTVLIAILLMCIAQLSKILCYRTGILFQFDLPETFVQMLPDESYRTITVGAPYLVLIPTILLSAGMLMFFTLGSAMVGDVCDEDELHTGTRSEGTYYSVFWWFIKMGNAFAILVAGILLWYTSFDQNQNVRADALTADFALIKSEAEAWLVKNVELADRIAGFDNRIERAISRSKDLQSHFEQIAANRPDERRHFGSLIEKLETVREKSLELKSQSLQMATDPHELLRHVELLLQDSTLLKQQSPRTLFRLRFVEIGLPLLLSIVSIWLTLRYPLTEARCYEIKEILKQRRADAALE